MSDVRPAVGLPYEIEITREGLRLMGRLPAKVRDAAIQTIMGPLATNPRRVGKPLVGELAGLYSARRGDYRVIYEMDDERRVVTVHRVHHRRDAYPPR